MSKPWLPYLATDYILRLHPRDIFEWGSGESTLFWVELGVKHLVSIEHNQDWYNKVNERIPKFTTATFGYFLIPYEPGEIGPDKANPLHYKSGSTELGPVNFKNYASAIDSYGQFDLILMDGMARASCLYHAINHVKPGGCIVLDNTGDRPYYLEQTAHLFGNYEAGWERIDFMGYGPILAYKWQTTVFINKGKADYE